MLKNRKLRLKLPQILMKSNSFEGHRTTEYRTILYNAGLSSEKLKQLEMGSAGSEMKKKVTLVQGSGLENNEVQEMFV